MKLLSLNLLEVYLNFSDNPKNKMLVGTLAKNNDEILFQYDREFIKSGLEISPFRLKLSNEVYQNKALAFNKLPGVFNDSLPDGWGRLLFDRLVRKNNLNLANISVLDRLAYQNQAELGALSYQPNYSINEKKINETLNLDSLASKSQEILTGESQEILEQLLSLNGSSAGARPKVLVKVSADKTKISHGYNKPQGKSESDSEFQNWMIKFPNTQDGSDAGAIEYVYSLMARRAGLNISETYLFSSKNNPGFFGTKRFDRHASTKKHLHSVAGLLHSDFRVPALDYKDLLNLTLRLTGDFKQVMDMFKIAVFNVLACNRDDHAKNFSFLMDAEGKWSLAPAYDLTFSEGPGGEQSTMLMGKGRDISELDLKSLGLEFGISRTIISEVIEKTKDSLSTWRKLALEFGVEASSVDYVGSCLNKVNKSY
jgi:serine/threonine-protein kinase HipA